MSTPTKTFLDLASKSIRGELNEIIIRKPKSLVVAPGIYDVVDKFHHNGPHVIFSGTKEQCHSFLQGLAWGAKAGRSAMAAQF